MKVIFLDIDGVLNSEQYDLERDFDDRQNIDESRLVLLKRLIAETDAKIVLSSLWRIHWVQEENKCDSVGLELNAIFGKYGLQIYDKTPKLNCFDRAAEIRSWLNEHGKKLETFAIIDDEFYGWEDLSEHLVQTNRRIGRGLEERHIQKVLALLNVDC